MRELLAKKKESPRSIKRPLVVDNLMSLAIILVGTKDSLYLDLTDNIKSRLIAQARSQPIG